MLFPSLDLNPADANSFGSVEGELLLSLVPVQAYWLDTLFSAASQWLLSLVPNWAHWPNTWLCRMWVATVSDTISRLLTEPPLGFCSMWVAAITDTVPRLLTKPTLGSAESELLLSLAPFQACWLSPPLDLQIVSACYLLISFITADKAYLSPPECGHFMALLTLTV